MPNNSLLADVILAAADRLAADQRIPDHARGAFRDAAVSVLRQQVAVLVGARVYVAGTSVRLQPLKRDPQRRERIAAALRAGESLASISRRERVTMRYVRRVRAALREADQ